MIMQDTVGTNQNFVSEYLFPTTIEEALEQLAGWAGEARLIAGGTDLMLDVEKKKILPRCFISTSQIRGINKITIDNDFVEIGAAVTFSKIKNDAYIQQFVPCLAEAARSVGSLAIQNSATLVGNIINAMPAADGVISMVALEAEAHIVDMQRSEWISVESLFLGPGSSRIDPSRQIVSHIRFQRNDRNRGTAWARLGRRPSLTLPILNCAVNIMLEDDCQIIKQARIVFGPVTPIPFRARRAEQFLQGLPVTPENLAQAAEIARNESNPRGNVLRASREYRLAVIPVLVENCLHTAAERAFNSASIRDVYPNSAV